MNEQATRRIVEYRTYTIYSIPIGIVELFQTHLNSTSRVDALIKNCLQSVLLDRLISTDLDQTDLDQRVLLAILQ